MAEGSKALFSVIVPIYNTEPYLRQCVDSLLGQSFQDFQLVLVDDGSPDGAGAICDEYAAGDSRITVVHKKNGGLVSARKAGLAVCTGEYVLNVDSDDYVSPDHLEKFAAVIREHHPQVVLCGATQFSGERQWPLKGALPEGLYAGDGMQTIRANLIYNEKSEQTILYNIWAAAVEREVYTPWQNAVPEYISRGEDLVVTAPMLAQCRTVYIMDHAGYYYRSNPTSIMNTFRTNEPDEIKRMVDYLGGHMAPEYSGRIDMYVATHYFDFLDRAMLQMSYGEYRILVRDTLDEELYGYLRRARCKENPVVQLVFALLRLRRFDLLWLLRKIKKRQV